MSQESEGRTPPSAPGPDGGGASRDGTLPPPAFPPGSRRIVRRRQARLRASGQAQGAVPEDAFIDPDEPIIRTRSGTVPDDAFIDPDEPIVREDALLDDAFIDPDEPIVRTGPPTKPEDFEEVVKGPMEEDEDEVVVTGIGSDSHLDDLKTLEKYGDPHVARLVEMVGRLADSLRQRGEAGLRTDADMTRFEASLRAYCTGWLAGRRESAGAE